MNKEIKLIYSSTVCRRIADYQLNNGTFTLNILMTNKKCYHTMLNCDYQMTALYF